MRYAGQSHKRPLGGGSRLGVGADWLSVIALTCLVAACGADATRSKIPTTVRASPPSTPTASIKTPLEGDWTTIFTATDESSIGWHFDPGTWTIVTHGEFTTLFRPAGTVMDSTNFELAGANEVIFPAEACPSEPQPTTGIYTFRITGDHLVFTEVRDSCANRAFQLTAHPWTKR